MTPRASQTADDHVSSVSFDFHLTSNIYSPVEVRVGRLIISHQADDLVEKDDGVPQCKSSNAVTNGFCQPGMGNRYAPMAIKLSVAISDAFGQVCPPLWTGFSELEIVPIDTMDECSCTWKSILTFPVKYKDLDITSQMVFTAWYVQEDVPLESASLRVLGGSSFPMFSKKGRLKTSDHKIMMYDGVEGDINVPSSTPHTRQTSVRIQEIRLLKRALKRYERNEMPREEWLDALALPVVKRQIEDIESKIDIPSLRFEFTLPKFQEAVLYCDMDASAVTQMIQSNAVSTADALNAQLPGTSSPAQGKYTTEVHDHENNSIILFSDPEIGRDTPAEVVAQKLARGARRGEEDRFLRPNTAERARIDAVLKSAPTAVLSIDDQELLWRFRYALNGEGRALTKFLQCVDWADADEATQARKLMDTWASIDIADALELLSPAFPIQHVRSHAVRSLEKTDCDTLQLFLLQLVQALRYEEHDTSELFNFLLKRALQNAKIASSLFWYLCSELDDPKFGSRAQELQTILLASVSSQSDGEFIVSKTCIPLQLNLVARMRHLFDSVRTYRSAEAKTSAIRKLISPGGSCEDLKDFQCPFPLEPTTYLCGVIPEDCMVFKSKVNPIKFVWRTRSIAEPSLRDNVPNATTDPMKHQSVTFIYKKGDDLRQDQLVLQMFSLMDRLLKKENVDLRITPYRVLPTSVEDGIIEFVHNAVPLSGVIREYGTIQRFLSHHAPSKRSPYGIRQYALNNYIRSCAGYTVFTHILGVGDRHNDNIMLTTEGKLFHIDFGYFLGRDPKFSNAPLVLSRVLIEGMGGSDSVEYAEFVQLCCEALNILRKSSNLLLSLIHVMAESSIPDIRSDPEMAILKLQEKLRLDLSDEEAATSFESILTAAQTAMLPRIAEVQHRVAQGWR